MRQVTGKAAWITGVLYVAFVGWSIYGAITPIETYIFRMVHMGLIFVLGFVTFPMFRRAGRWGLFVDILLALAGAATIIYALSDLDQFIRRSTLPEPLDFAMGGVTLVATCQHSH